MIGWRKLGAWALIYAFVAVASLAFKYEIPANNVDLVKWVTTAFFVTNAAKPAAQGIKALAERKADK